MFWICALFLALVAAAYAAEESGDEKKDWRNLPIGHLKFGGAGDLSSDVLALSLWGQLRDIGGSPWFTFVEGRGLREKYEPYDLHGWGGNLGVGRALSQVTDVELRYRHDRYSVFNLGQFPDPAIRAAQGIHDVGALGILFQKDTRDDAYATTGGMRLRWLAEAAFEEAGGDDNFGRLEWDAAWYRTPFSDRGGTLGDLTFVEYFRIGWMENFGSTDEVPFYERYFVGGGSTVRGHRTRWLSPRGAGEQFIGGEVLLLNNFEVRLPIFKERFKKKLWTAGFFDAGRAFRRFSDVGDFGYGLGVGLRYVVHVWEIHGVLRADVGFNPAPEGDDATSALHVAFGLPF